MASINIFLGTKPLRNEALNIKFTPTDKIQATTVQDAISEVLSKGGVPIVDSVDKLDPNAPQGSLASVAVNTFGEVPFSELYQPTSDEVNMNAGVIDTTNLSSVGSISINSAYDTSAEIQYFLIYLFTKDFDMQGEVGQTIILVPEGALTMNFSTQEQQNLELLYPNEDGTITINEENLATINNLLSSTEFVYGGVMSMDSGEFIDPSYADVFYKAIGSIQKTDLYIKDVEGWKVVGDEKLKDKVDNLQTIIDNLENTVNNLEDKTDLIVNSVEELPDDVLLGTLAQVVFKKEKATSLNTITYSQEITADNLVVLAPKQLYEEIYLPPLPVGTIIFKTQSGKSITIYLGSASGGPSEVKIGLMWSIDGAMPTILLGYSEEGELIVDNREAFVNKITTDRYYFRASDNTGFGTIADYFVGLKPIIVYANTTKLFIKNINGWEQYSELVDGSVTTEKLADKAITLDKLSEDISEVIENCPIAVESVDSLPSNAKIGTIASVLETTVEEKVLTGTVGPTGARVVHVEIEETTPMVMGSLEFILTTRDGKNIEIRSLTTSGYPTDGHRLYFIDPNSNEFTLATFGSPYSNAEQNSENIETLNQLLQNDKYYGKQGYTQSEATAINDFFRELIIEKENTNTKLYVKNTSGWEEYDKANKDKVAALETKVAELEAKIQELLQNS